MKPPVHKPKKTGDGEISFPALQCWNPVTKTATIAAEVDGRRISCRISIQDLKKKFRIFTDNPMQSVTDHRSEIESAATRLINNKDFEDDDSILIAYKDL